MKANADPGEISPSISWGRRLLKFGGLALLAGNGVSRAFFPALRGKGVSPAMWWVLVPIWSAIMSGCLLCLAGWLKFPQIAPKREVWGKRYFTPLLIKLWAFLAGIMMLVGGTMMILVMRLSFVQFFGAYWLFSVAAFAMFLTTLYSDSKYPVTTTYINVLYPVYAVPIFPLTWPLVMALEVVESRKSKIRRSSYLDVADSSKSVMQNVLRSCQVSFGERPRAFSRLDRHTYLRVPKPLWVSSDPPDRLSIHFDNLDTLLSNGVVVWGYVVQANERLFATGDDNCPGELVYSLSASVEPRYLQRVAGRLIQLKGTQPDDPNLRRIADYLTDEYIRVYGLRVPDSISPIPCRISTTFFVREHLPLRQLSEAFLPIIVNRQKPRVVMPLPERFWPEELIEWWSEVDDC